MTMTTSNNIVETRFLKNQQARVAAVSRRHETEREHKAQVSQLWTRLQNEMAAWRQRLQSGGKRQEALRDLAVLQNDLSQLQKEVLTMELPISDVTLLHKEFGTCWEELQRVRDEICPPTKFVFRRYRAALLEKQQQINQSQENNTVEQGDTLQQQYRTKVCMGRAIQDLQNATIVEDENGTITIVQQNKDPMVIPTSTETALVLQNLCQCHVTITARYQMVHLLHITESVITFTSRIDGALHVTACHKTDIIASSHQIRLHESHFVNLTLVTTPSIILEDCTNLIISTRSEQDAADLQKSTKDFNWFRTNEPSPNYCIQVNEDKHVEQNKEDKESSVASPVQQLKVVDIQEQQAPTTTLEGGLEADDEDEL